MERVEAVAVGLGQIRLQLYGPAVTGDRFVQSALVLQSRVAQVIVCGGKIRLQLQGPAG